MSGPPGRSARPSASRRRVAAARVQPWDSTRGLIEREVKEKIVLVGLAHPRTPATQVEASLDELSLLVETAGAMEVGRILQRRSSPDPAYFIGRGKVEELVELALATDADTVVFDDELSPAQQRNLTAALGRTAIDRTAVILDIFAQNASTPEGRAQVELAILRYRLPHLRGRGLALSQQAGGIGTRGPGETQLETDRRRLLQRIHALEREIKSTAASRRTQRKARLRGSVPQVSIVGYTNAGKSTLLNRLTDAGVVAADRLFSTLDPRVRRMRLPGGGLALVSDTVGFVRKLPHQLVEAFRSTLEAVREADLLLHVVDASATDALGQVAAVRAVLEEIGAGSVEELMVVNKVDRLAELEVRRLCEQTGGLAVSALFGTGVDDLEESIERRLAVRQWRRSIQEVGPVAMEVGGTPSW